MIFNFTKRTVSETASFNMKHLGLFVIGLILSISVAAQNKYTANGWYITKNGDTIYGYLKIKESMYLIAQNAEGKRKSLTPSKVKQVRIGHSTYVPMYLKEFDKKRFVTLRIKGKCSLYVYEDATRALYAPAMGVGPALIAAGTDASFYAHNSGAYLKFENDENYYSVPLNRKPFNKFICHHFSKNQEIISRLDEEWKEMIPFLAELIMEYNKIERGEV